MDEIHQAHHHNIFSQTRMTSNTKSIEAKFEITMKITDFLCDKKIEIKIITRFEICAFLWDKKKIQATT